VPRARIRCWGSRGRRFKSAVPTGKYTHEPALHEAWAEEVDQTRILVRTAASPFGDVTGNGSVCEPAARL
jgi:hypothetical protein